MPSREAAAGAEAAEPLPSAETRAPRRRLTFRVAIVGVWVSWVSGFDVEGRLVAKKRLKSPTEPVVLSVEPALCVTPRSAQRAPSASLSELSLFFQVFCAVVCQGETSAVRCTMEAGWGCLGAQQA